MIVTDQERLPARDVLSSTLHLRTSQRRVKCPQHRKCQINNVTLSPVATNKCVSQSALESVDQHSKTQNVWKIEANRFVLKATVSSGVWEINFLMSYVQMDSVIAFR